MMSRCTAVLVLAAGFALAATADVRAADLGMLPAAPLAAAPSDGVPCESPVTQAFDSVWLGHFTGGYMHRLGPGLPIALDWRDEKLCFPSRHSCDRYISGMRRDFHHPEGYFTCLPIR